jgi:hypothetical protein
LPNQLTARELAIISKWRPQHSPVVSLDRSISDSAGMIGFPLVAIGPLARLEQKGWITASQRQAGEHFSRLFQRAGLDELKAADLGRIPGNYRAPGLPHSAEAARRRVHDIMQALGGHASITGSAIWHVVGLEWAVRRWALETRRHNESVAKGILIAALAQLEMAMARRA